MERQKSLLDEIWNLKTALAQLEKTNQEQADTIRELRLRESQYYDILDNMSEPVEKELPDYRISYVNKAYLDYFEVDEDEIIGTDSFAVVHEDDKPAVFELMDSLTPENPTYRYECRTLKKSGEFAWIEVTGCVFFDDQGNVAEYQEVVRDVTRYVKAQDELEEKVRQRTKELTKANDQLQKINRYWQGILQNMSEGVVVIDVEGRVEFLNTLPIEGGKMAERELRQMIRNEILGEEMTAVKNLLVHRERFANAELNYPFTTGMVRFLASGFLLEPLAGQAQKAAVVLQPMKSVHRLVNRLSGAQAQVHFEDILTCSLNMQEVIRMARSAAKSDSTVLIEGESGTGKELFAQSIHNDSVRRQEPFIAVNCAAIPRELVASELFGYDEGAFTGAKKGGKPGKFELAAGGTLFLDEIGDMPMEQQVALLRVIQERKYSRVGGGKEIATDVRLICATNRDLLQEVAAGNFRKDLYYRLNVINLQIPPLRDRKDDILLLFHAFLKKAGVSHVYNINTIDPDIFNILLKYNWPGNVRELQNSAERMVFLAGRYPLTLEHLPNHFFRNQEPSMPSAPPSSLHSLPLNNPSITDYRAQLKEIKAEEEAKHIMELLEANGGNVSKTARDMGISRTELYRKMKRYQAQK